MLFSRSNLIIALSTPLLSVTASLELVSRATSPSKVTAGVLCGIGLLNSCSGTTPGINTLTDASNCGVPGTVCSVQTINSLGASSCVAGQCTTACGPGLTYSSALGACINTAYMADPSNCGSFKTVCNVGNGTPKCEAGKCSAFGCFSGFTLVDGVCKTATTLNDPLNCGTVGFACPILNGDSLNQCQSGKCVVAGCITGFVLKLNQCVQIDLNNDPVNCGALGMYCGAGSLCATGICSKVDCPLGSAFSAAVNACEDVTNNPLNCGTIGNVCPSSSTTIATCVAGACKATVCTSPYTIVNRVCALPPSQAAKQNIKRGKVVKRKTLCPGEETACPIVGSASFVLAQSQGFTHFKSADLTELTNAGGYECLDTKYAIESCGGCASMGDADTGVNCLSLPHSSGVGCDNSKCVIFSCKAGFRPNLTATACVPSTPVSNRRKRSSNVKRSLAHGLSHASH